MQQCILDREAIERVLERLTSEILERHSDVSNLVLVGIERRGADLARRLCTLLQDRTGEAIHSGTLDINLYRDDWTSIKERPFIGTSHISVDLTERIVLLIDDVLYSGRTIRAALDALLAYGRPRAVELLVLIDRGHRELPIQANYVGKVVETRAEEQVSVYFAERDGEDSVLLEQKPHS